MEENSFSIINRSNGQISGQSANALPIKLETSLSWMKLILIGFGISAVIFNNFPNLDYLSFIKCVGLAGKKYNIFQSHKNFGILPDYEDFRITFLKYNPYKEIYMQRMEEMEDRI